MHVQTSKTMSQRIILHDGLLAGELKLAIILVQQSCKQVNKETHAHTNDEYQAMQFCSLCDLGTRLVVLMPGGRSVFYPNCERVEKASADWGFSTASYSSLYVLSFSSYFASPYPAQPVFKCRIYLHSVKWLVTLLVPYDLLKSRFVLHLQESLRMSYYAVNCSCNL